MIHDPENSAYRRKDFIQSLSKGLNVLSIFGQSCETFSITQISTLTGLSRPTARRLLLTLERLGFLEREGRNYMIGPKFIYFSLSSFLTHQSEGQINLCLEKMAKLLKSHCTFSLFFRRSLIPLYQAGQNYQDTDKASASILATDQDNTLFDDLFALKNDDEDGHLVSFDDSNPNDYVLSVVVQDCEKSLTGVLRSHRTVKGQNADILVQINRDLVQMKATADDILNLL